MDKNDSELKYWRPLATKVLGAMGLMCLIITVVLITEATGTFSDENGYQIQDP